MLRNFPLLSVLAVLLSLFLPGSVRAQEIGEIGNSASVSYGDNGGQTFQGVLTSRMRLIDPRGQVRGCNGALLADYTGFRIGLYDATGQDPAHADLRTLLALTPTAAVPGAGLPLGVDPNLQNANPFALSNASEGTFSFLLDPSRGQLDPGRAYVLVLSPPAGTDFRERRVLITIGARDGDLLTYTAASLDGEPVSATDGRMTLSRYVAIQDASQNGLALAALNVNLSDCQARPVQITKVGDRSAAEPGDTVVYRVGVHNRGLLPLDRVVVTDTLPVGFDLRTDSVRATNGDKAVTLDVHRQGRVATFALPAGQTVAAGDTLSIAYGALLTPSALRGDGQNSASVTARAVMTMLNGGTMVDPVSDGPAVYGVQIRQGLLSDTGTLIGRVFVDTNQDGEQQRGEPGIPDAVVVLDDSTRIVTDANGLFSVPTVTAGYHAAVLDFRSVPGYVLAPNNRFLERRGPARLIHLEPGGLARANFGLLPRTSATPASGAPVVPAAAAPNGGG